MFCMVDRLLAIEERLTDIPGVLAVPAVSGAAVDLTVVVSPPVPSCNVLVVVDAGWLEIPPKVKPVAGVVVEGWFCDPVLIVKPVLAAVAGWVGWLPKEKPVEGAFAGWLGWLVKVNPVAAVLAGWLDWFAKLKPVAAALAVIIRNISRIRL